MCSIPVITRKSWSQSEKKDTMYRGIKIRMKVDFLLEVIQVDKTVDKHAKALKEKCINKFFWHQKYIYNQRWRYTKAERMHH